MTRPRLTRRRAAAGLAVVWTAAGLALTTTAGGSGSAVPADALLPDLDAAAPKAVQVASVRVGARTRYRLSFASAAENVGDGPLVIQSSRPDRSTPTMDADQVLMLAGGGTHRVADIGTTRYVVDPTHQHWHLLRAMAYELRTANGRRLVRPDRKTGFCLGDRYELDVGTDLPGKPATMVYNVDCGYDSPGLLAVEEGISVGWGDNYEPWRDGQFIDVTGLPAGRYLLVHRVDPDARFVELTRRNNGSSALIALAWPAGRQAPPRVRVVATCADTATCSPP